MRNPDRMIAPILLSVAVAACQPEVNTTLLPSSLTPPYEPSTGTPSPTPHFIRTPDPDATNVGALAEAQIYPTGQAAQEQGRDNTFVPEGHFTQEIFDMVRPGVVGITVYGPLWQGLCTGWIADISDSTMTIVTAAHCLGRDIGYGDEVQAVSLYRPFMDDEVYEPEILRVLKHKERDIAAIVVKKPENLAPSYRPLAWRDNFATPQNVPLLQLGFPGILFQNSNNEEIDHERMLLASVVATAPGAADNNGLYTVGFGSASAGCSGGPVIMVDQDRPVVIGIMSFLTRVTDDPREYTILSLLDLERLLEDVQP